MVGSRESSTTVEGTSPTCAATKTPSIATSRPGTRALVQIETSSPAAMNPSTIATA